MSRENKTPAQIAWLDSIERERLDQSWKDYGRAPQATPLRPADYRPGGKTYAYLFDFGRYVQGARDDMATAAFQLREYQEKRRGNRK